jgi:hypothetical protein
MTYRTAVTIGTEKYRPTTYYHFDILALALHTFRIYCVNGNITRNSTLSTDDDPYGPKHAGHYFLLLVYSADRRLPRICHIIGEFPCICCPKHTLIPRPTSSTRLVLSTGDCLLSTSFILYTNYLNFFCSVLFKAVSPTSTNCLLCIFQTLTQCFPTYGSRARWEQAKSFRGFPEKCLQWRIFCINNLHYKTISRPNLVSLTQHVLQNNLLQFVDRWTHKSHHHHHHMALQPNSCPGLHFWGFIIIRCLQGWIVSPAPNPQPGGPGLRIYDPRRQDGPAVPPGTGYPI